MQQSPTFMQVFARNILSVIAVAIGMIASGSLTAVVADQPKDTGVLRARLDELKSQMTELKTAIESGEGDLTQSKEDYDDALEETEKLIDQLLEASLVAIENDSTDAANIRTAMGILLNEADNENDGKVLRACDRLIKAGVNKAYFDYAARAERISLKAREIFDEVLIRQREFKADDLPRVLLKTNKGDITVELFENEAPQTVGNFVSLVESGFYKDALFHRVIENFMAQVGGPKKDGKGDDDPGYTIYDECDRPDTRPHFTGVVSMAKTMAPDSGSSQFYITFVRTSHLDGKHTVFGRVIDGHQVVEKIARTEIEINGESTAVPNANPDLILSAKVLRKRDHVYRPRKVGEPEEKEEVQLPPLTPQSATTKDADEDATTKDLDKNADEDADEGDAEKSQDEDEAKKE